MKYIKTAAPTLFFVLLMNVIFSSANAQKAEYKEVVLKTSAVCEMCKETIEKALNVEKGVKIAILDVKTKNVTIKYNPEKTNVEALIKTINLAGYDAEDSPAD